MRNGLSLYPICLPGMPQQPNQVSQARVDVYDTDKYLNVNMTKEMSMNQNIPADSLLRLPENCVKREHVSDFGKPSEDAESSLLQHHFGAFQLSRSFKVSFLHYFDLLHYIFQSFRLSRTTKCFLMYFPEEGEAIDMSAFG